MLSHSLCSSFCPATMAPFPKVTKDLHKVKPKGKLSIFTLHGLQPALPLLIDHSLLLENCIQMGFSFFECRCCFTENFFPS